MDKMKYSKGNVILGVLEIIGITFWEVLIFGYLNNIWLVELMFLNFVTIISAIYMYPWKKTHIKKGIMIALLACYALVWSWLLKLFHWGGRSFSEYMFSDWNTYRSDVQCLMNKACFIGTSQEMAEVDKVHQFLVDNSNYVILLKDNKYILECPNVITNVYTKTDVSLNFSNILVDGNLSILKEVSQEQNVELFSSNKYLVKTTNASLNDERITLKGQLCTEELVSKSLFNDNEIYLAPDFSITAESSDAEIEYQYAGWNIKGKGVKYEYHKIIIEENKIEFNGKTIPLGKLSFNDDFELIDSSELEQDIDVKLLSDKSKILYTRFSSEGLNVRGEIYLPAPFDNCSIIFEKIYLESNGNFYVKTAVKEKNFSLLVITYSL